MSEDLGHDGPTDDRLEHASVRSEKSDANFTWILAILIATVVAAFFVHYCIWRFYSSDRAYYDEARKSRFPLAPAPSRALPKEPRLEPLDRLEEKTGSNVFLREQAHLEVLDSYGPAADAGYVHIPIDQAIRHLAGRLPARSETAGATAVLGAGTVGLLAGMNPLLAASALAPGQEGQIQASLQWRQNGLVAGGEPNSGRMINTRRPGWFGK
jgi:hypothetical protein